MSTLTYVKGLPTPASELNVAGYTQMEAFLAAVTPIFREAAIVTVNELLGNPDFNKSSWNTFLQRTFKINKRYANGVIAYAKGKVDSAKELRDLHIKTLEGKVKSIDIYIKKAEKKIKTIKKQYVKSRKQLSWLQAKQIKLTGHYIPLANGMDRGDWHRLQSRIHHKKRKRFLLLNKIQHLKTKSLTVKVPHDQFFIVGSKGEKLGNQTAQWDGNTLKIRVPECLENRFGKYVESNIGGFERNINRLPVCNAETAKTWHIYRKDGAWKVAVQFTPLAVNRQSRHRNYGCIGIDMNPGSIGWAYVDCQGNLKAKGQIPLEMGLPSGKQQAQIVKACLTLADLAIKYACPVVMESLDFSDKKQRLGEVSKKMARMLSGWAYSEFGKQLASILANRGIQLIEVNPAYSSAIGLVKYMRMYGLSSDCAAALVIARRAMRLSERLSGSLKTYAAVNADKHFWSQWNQLNKQIKRSAKINRRHDYFSISNWSFLANAKESRDSESEAT